MAILTASLILDALLLLLGILALVIFFFRQSHQHWRKMNVPFLKPDPFVGNTWNVFLQKENLGLCLSRLYSEAKGNPCVGIYILNKPILLIRDLDLVKAVLVKDFNYFMDRIFSPNEEKDPLFVKNLFGMNGPRWRHLRAKLSPTFTSGKMKMMFHLVNECGKELAEVFGSKIQDNPELEVKEVVARFTTDAVASVGMGVRSNAQRDDDAEFRLILRKTVDPEYVSGVKFSLAFSFPKLLSLLKMRIWPEDISEFCRRVVWQTVKHREQTGETRKDFLDLLMQLRKNGHLDDETSQSSGSPAQDKYPLEGDDFVAQAFVFLAAGFETSSSTLTFALYELARHPHIQTRLRKEIQEALRADEGRLTYEAMQNMTFLQQVISETLRLYPILPFLDRVAIQDYHLPNSNIRLSKGDAIMIPVMGIQRDPQHFEDPDTFKPERWSEGNKQKIPAYSFLAFGEGPRNCIGMRMGLMQTKIGLIHLLNNYEVRPCSKTAIPLVIDPRTNLLSAKDGVYLKITPVHATA